MRTFITTLLDLIFPPCCLACNQALLSGEKNLCTHCLATLPQSWEDLLHTPHVEERFWGEVPLHYAASLFQFTKKGPLQNLMHKVKYCNKRSALQKLGRYYGGLLKHVEQGLPIDTIIPVPLHHRRLRERGYNQSSFLAKGMAHALRISFHPNWLRRRFYTETQTKKKIELRRDNVRGAFQVTRKADVCQKHILLVDDLVTTGSTLKECAHALLEAGAKTISVAVLAVAV